MLIVEGSRIYIYDGDNCENNAGSFTIITILTTKYNLLKYFEKHFYTHNYKKLVKSLIYF